MTDVEYARERVAGIDVLSRYLSTRDCSFEIIFLISRKNEDWPINKAIVVTLS